MVATNELRELIGGHHEWLLIRNAARSFSLNQDEIDVGGTGEKAHFGFLDDEGFHTWRINSFANVDGEIAIDVAGAFSQKRETMRLVPRVAIAELTAEVELARLIKAGQMADLVKAKFAGSKLGRGALNAENGRFAQIDFETGDRRPMAAIGDVVGSLTVETIFTAAILWVEKLGMRRNKPVNEIVIVCERPQARNAQHLHALLNTRWQSKITVAEIRRKTDPPKLVLLPPQRFRDLWREKAPKITLSDTVEVSETARRIVSLAPGQIDIVRSRQGETLRFAGLPFARVRRMMGQEKAWVGVGGHRRPLEQSRWKEVVALVDELEQYRLPFSTNTRHEFYRAAPEAWLESILRRDIALLDSNLILSPIYHQFRSARAKIDLLALRRDGRLVIIELKTQPDRESVFQAADYWRKVELQRRRGILAAANLFDGLEILDKPALIYVAAPAWSFHRDFEFFARSLSPEIELWRFELHENWRENVKVIARQNYAEPRTNL
ncbi:MAG: hypothetical protein WKF34_01415 [Pyrinomonadaceae bacterium]